jgi:folate-dependent tRNA-U54 methylase TrmFO/GidA
MAGVEGYVESAALGYLAGVGVARQVLGLSHETPPPETAHGALLRHLQNADAKHFQPMNVNYGLFPPLDRAVVDGALAGLATVESTAVGAGDIVNRVRRGGRRKLPKRERNEMLAARALESLAPYRERVRPRVLGAE